MCGRYEFNDEKDIEEIHKIIQEINNKYHNADVVYKTGEIYPTNIVPVLSDKDGVLNLSLMSWGFPKWDNKGVVINAKSETASEKRMFLQPLLSQRCVIPATGFYEWQRIDVSKAKDKYLFTVDGSPMLYMAGIYNRFKEGDHTKECFVILTRASNDSIHDIHDRMPVILYKNELKDWIRQPQFTDFAIKREDVVLNRELCNKKAG